MTRSNTALSIPSFATECITDVRLDYRTKTTGQKNTTLFSGTNSTVSLLTLLCLRLSERNLTLMTDCYMVSYPRIYLDTNRDNPTVQKYSASQANGAPT